MFPKLTTQVHPDTTSNKPSFDTFAILEFEGEGGLCVSCLNPALELTVQGSVTSIQIRDRAGEQMIAALQAEFDLFVIKKVTGGIEVLDPESRPGYRFAVVRRIQKLLADVYPRNFPMLVGQVSFETLAQVTADDVADGHFILPSRVVVSQTGESVDYVMAGSGEDVRLAQPREEFNGIPMSREVFLEAVDQVQNHLQAGDVYQTVLSRFKECAATKTTLEQFKDLKELTGAPFMFALQSGSTSLVGASPERHLRVTPTADGLSAELMPIAGTRPLDQDGRFLTSLRMDAKELSEHIMLVDLARNDLAGICRPGTRRVSELMTVRACGPVQHLVSQVEGQLSEGIDALAALEALGPMGTLSGAPKKRAIELIQQLEDCPRGSYGGAVLALFADGSLDSAIVIRAIETRAGRCRLQAGAGIVLDSVAEREFDEISQKMSSAMAVAGVGV